MTNGNNKFKKHMGNTQCIDYSIIYLKLQDEFTLHGTAATMQLPEM